jgi:hypothetical protein
MKHPNDKLQPQSRTQSLRVFFAIVLGCLGLDSTWRLFELGQPILTPILGGILFGLLYVLVDRIWRREGEYLKRYMDVPEQKQEDYTSSSNLRH